FGNMTLNIREPRGDAEIAQVMHAAGAPVDGAIQGRSPSAWGQGASINSISLRQVSLTLNCRIPIGTSGLFLTSASGTVTIGGGSTRIDIAERIGAGTELFAGQALIAC